jgi:hypothetical protein
MDGDVWEEKRGKRKCAESAKEMAIEWGDWKFGGMERG